MPTSYDLFVSYAHADDADGFVSAFVDALQAEHHAFALHHLDIFIDHDSIELLSDWEQRILSGLRGAKMMLAVLSPAYFASAWCRREWDWFVQHEQDRAAAGEAIAPLYTVTVPGFEAEAAAQLDAWRGDLRRRDQLDVRDWRTEGAAVFQRAEVQRRLQRLDQDLDVVFSKQERREAGVTTVPAHNPQFVGRVEELRALHLAMTGGAIAAVQGLGGIGKSALAFEYAHAFADHYPGGRFLIPCAGTGDLRIPMLNLSALLGVELDEHDRRNLAAAYAKIRAALEASERTLLLFDNVNDPDLVSADRQPEWLPSGDRVHVLITTRCEPDRLPGVVCQNLGSLTAAESAQLIERYRSFEDDLEADAAENIGERLGGHPLSVEVVAVYLARNPDIPVDGYLTRLEREGLKALEGAAADDQVELSRHRQKMVGDLLAPTLAALTPAELRAAEYAAFLAPDNVAMPWLRDLCGADYPEAIAEPSPGEPDPWRQILRRLLGLRLLTPGDGEHLARMHRVVQAVLRARLAADGGSDARQAATLAYVQTQAEGLANEWTDAAARWKIDPAVDLAKLLLANGDVAAGADLANALAWPMSQLGLIVAADEALTQSLAAQDHDAAAAPTDRLAGCCYELAGVKRDLGDLDAAHTLYARALDLFRAVNGASDPNLVATASTMALLAQEMGNLTEAADLLRRAESLGERVYPPDEPELAIIYNHRALLSRQLGHLEESLDLCQRSTSIMCKAYGPDSPSLAANYNTLAMILCDLGRLDPARQMAQRSVDILSKILPDDHPAVSAAYHTLALIERDAGNLERAHALLEKTLAAEEKAYRPDNAVRAMSYVAMASVERLQGNLARADELASEAVAVLAGQLPASHRRVLEARFELAQVLGAQGKRAEAVALAEQVYAAREQTVGTRHYETVKVREWLDRAGR